MSKRIFKQSIVLAVFLLITGLISYAVYLTQKPDPTCFDGLQNQDESDIDCGGVCTPCELINVKDLEVIWTQPVISVDGYYDFAAKITNPNQNFGSGQAPYTVQFINVQGDIIQERRGDLFINPGQTKYLVLTRIKIDQPFAEVVLAFGDINWAKPEIDVPAQLFVQNKEFKQLPEGAPARTQVTGLLANKTNYNFESVIINILLFGSGQELVAVNGLEINTLLVDQERDFIAQWYHDFRTPVQGVDIEVGTNIFDKDNFAPYGGNGVEPFQQY